MRWRLTTALLIGIGGEQGFKISLCDLPFLLINAIANLNTFNIAFDQTSLFQFL